MDSASIAQVKKSLVSGLKIPLKMRVGQVGSEEGSRLREIGKVGKTALKIDEGSGRPFIQLGTTGSESVRWNNDRLSCVRDGLSELSESESDRGLVPLELVIGKEGIRSIARTLFRRDPDSVRLTSHSRRLPAKPSLLQVVAKEKYLVGVRTDKIASYEPYSLDLVLHMSLVRGTDRRTTRDEIIPSL